MGLSLRSWIANEGGKHCILITWLSVSAWIFWRTFILYCSGAEYHYLHKMLGLGLCISRASATVLNLNCSLVLLPMCRSILTVLRGTRQVSSKKARRLLDKSKTFHVTCGVAICVFSVVHVGAHLVNVVSFSVRYSDEFPALNVAHYRGQSVPGITGVLLVLVLFLMFTASSHSVRVGNYEIFWYTHNLFILFYVVLLMHVVGGALKYQTNVDAHPPGCIPANQTRAHSDTWPNQEVDGELVAESREMSLVCKEDAHFQPHFPQTWLWVLGPLCLYCGERLYRYIRCNASVTIVSVVRHPCDVIEVRMLKNSFKARPGQVSPTLSSAVMNSSSCPTENKETFGIHVRVVGDWTACFSELLLPDLEHSEILPMTNQRRYPNDEWRRYKLQRLYFVWVCRELNSFYWFAELLCGLHRKLWEQNRPDYLNIRLYLTTAQELQNLTDEKYRPLHSRLLIGRPKLKLLFEEIGRSNQHKKVGVFCCAPKGVSRELHKLCNSFSASGTVFEYNKESFS
uniref:NADPH oxidase 4 n=1 Tax=Electrophorus electricus TaxID=8005 RepID=A0A4W4DTC6_ELEEL